MVLVDTSVLIHFLKGRVTPATSFFESIAAGDFYITPIIFQEILQGAGNRKEFETLRSYLQSQNFCFPIDAVSTHELAAKIYFECRRKGFTIRSSIDCLIAQIAIDNNLFLLHEDFDFNNIAKVSTLKCVSL